MLALILQHYYKLNFLSNWVGKLQKEEQRPNRRYSSLSIFSLSNYSYTTRRASVHHPRFPPCESIQGCEAYPQR